MAKPKDLQALVVVLGNLAYVRPGLVLQHRDGYISVLWMYNLARRDILEDQMDVSAITTPIYWSENDPDKKTVIWMETKAGPRVWAAEPGSKLVPRVARP